MATLYTTVAAFQVLIARAMAENTGDISGTGVHEPEKPQVKFIIKGVFKPCTN